MKVFVESRFILQSRNGISRDSKSIVKILKSDQNVDLQTFILAQSKFSRGLEALKALLNGHPRHIDFGRARVYIPQLQWYLPKSRGTGIIRIHDIYPITNPEWFKRISVRVFRMTLENAIQNDNLFVCNSLSTRNSLLSIYPTARTEIIYCYSDPVYARKCGDCEYCINIDQITKKRFVLSVGTIEPRKNYERLIRVWKNVLNLHDLHLIIVGKYGWKSGKAFRLLNRKNHNFRYFQDVCDGGVQELTKSCQAYLSASLGEGFNLPAMDAARNSKPLVLSDIPIHRELFGKMATYLHPEDEFSISQAIERIVLNNLEPLDTKLIPNPKFDDQVRHLILKISKETNE